MINIYVLDGALNDNLRDLILNILPQIPPHYSYTLGELDINLGSDDWLLEINKDFLNHDYLTDIITFNYNEGTLIAGEICISLDRVNDNASTFKVPRETELLRVVIHGVLHLCGLKDKTDDEKSKMREAEDYFLNKLALL
jgi:rRNA maturation RNase YbeY